MIVAQFLFFSEESLIGSDKDTELVRASFVFFQNEFLHGALAILVRLQISQLGFLGKCFF